MQLWAKFFLFALQKCRAPFWSVSKLSGISHEILLVHCVEENSIQNKRLEGTEGEENVLEVMTPAAVAALVTEPGVIYWRRKTEVV